jgi:hypothetical protein
VYAVFASVFLLAVKEMLEKRWNARHYHLALLEIAAMVKTVAMVMTVMRVRDPAVRNLATQYIVGAADSAADVAVAAALGAVMMNPSRSNALYY